MQYRKRLRAGPHSATIHLSHTPLETENAAKARMRLMLCGHTHRGQIWPFDYLNADTYCVNGCNEADG
jgi:predicted MPP superfamily phosphohydrolase